MMAAIDAGSNTLRLLMGSVIDGKVVPERYMRRICRLAGDLSDEKGIPSQARERTLLVLQKFIDTCRQADIGQIKDFEK